MFTRVDTASTRCASLHSRNTGTLSMRTVYLDNNIVSYIADGSMALPEKADLQPVYSAEHFNEIARGTTPGPALDALSAMHALEVVVNRNEKDQILDTAELVGHDDIHARYAEHVSRMAVAEPNLSMFRSFIARSWGADNDATLKASVRALPDNILPGDLLGEHPEVVAKARRVSADLLAAVVENMPNPLPLKATREHLGAHSNQGGQPPSAVHDLWRQVAPSLPGVTIDQLFGKDPVDRLDYDRWPTYLAIVTCHHMLNTLGFRSDLDMEDERKTSNIMSDGVHIANAAFCDVLLTADKRLHAKAVAIYAFLGSKTVACHISAPATVALP